MDGIALALAFFFSYALRFEFAIPGEKDSRPLSSSCRWCCCPVRRAAGLRDLQLRLALHRHARRSCRSCKAAFWSLLPLVLLRLGLPDAFASVADPAVDLPDDDGVRHRWGAGAAGGAAVRSSSGSSGPSGARAASGEQAHAGAAGGGRPGRGDGGAGDPGQHRHEPEDRGLRGRRSAEAGDGDPRASRCWARPGRSADWWPSTASTTW